jgi:hypothetical protein
LPAVGGQQRPCDGQVTGRIADAAGAEVDDRRQLPVAEQQISLSDVTVEPVLRTVPARVKGGLPDLARQPASMWPSSAVSASDVDQAWNFGLDRVLSAVRRRDCDS